MRLDEYAALDAVGLVKAIRAGETDPVAVVEAAIAAIESLDPRLNALVLKDFTRARERAAAVAREAALAGVPFLIKDVDVYTVEWPTTFSSRFLADSAPRPDSAIVARWRAAGSVFLGKTNTPEFADDFATEPAWRGATLNPWDPGLTVGGSSGGAAAAVASGMVPVAHGSDVGGSIRVPSACCGLFGLKPSRALNPSGPHFGAEGGGLNCQHVLSRSVRDSAAFLDASAGPEHGAPYRVHRVDSYLAALGRRSEPLRVVCLPRRLDETPVAVEIEEKLHAACDLMRRLGHEVQMGSYPNEVVEATRAEGWTPLWMMDVAYAVRERTAQLGREPHADEMEPLARGIVARMAALSALDYLDAKRAAHRAALAMAREFDAYDVIMTPTTSTLPPAVGSFGSTARPFDYGKWVAASYGFAPFTEIFNVTGQPAASLPLFESSAGLPIGIQLVMQQGCDAHLLHLAARLEEMTAWSQRHPPLWAGAL